jgi:hypothetical protein
MTRIPGFTATDAVDRRATRRYAATAATPVQRPSSVTPQMLPPLGGGRPCNPTCLCVTEEGCPCCARGPLGPRTLPPLPPFGRRR